MGQHLCELGHASESSCSICTSCHILHRCKSLQEREQKDQTNVFQVLVRCDYAIGPVTRLTL